MRWSVVSLVSGQSDAGLGDAYDPTRRDSPGNVEPRSGDLRDNTQAIFACPHWNEVPSTQMQWRMTAIFRATATLAFFIPTRLTSFMPQAFRQDHLLVRAAARLLPPFPTLRFSSFIVGVVVSVIVSRRRSRRYVQYPPYDSNTKGDYFS